MSTSQPDQRRETPPATVFQREIVDDYGVCDNCYRPTHETVEPWSSNAPDTMSIRREDTTEIAEHGMFCACGSEGGSAQIRPRSVGMFIDHARNAARTLSQRGFDIDVGTVVEVAEEMKTSEGMTGQEELILAHAVEIALGD